MVDMRMKGEFKRGDVVVKIGGSQVYVIDGAYETATWYGITYACGGTLHHSQIDIDLVDDRFVKIDKCKDPWKDNEVALKLNQLADQMEKGGLKCNGRVQYW